MRRIAGVNIVEGRRVKDLREVGAKACIVGKIVKSRMNNVIICYLKM